jgi:hypothetical protein
MVKDFQDSSILFNFQNKKMARSHHRKKHKEHLKHFHNRQEAVSGISKKGKSTWVIAVLGGAIGYFIGQRLDKAAG